MKWLWAFAVTLTVLAAACSSPEATAIPTATIEPTATVTAPAAPLPTLTPTAVIAAGPRSLSMPRPTPATAQAGFTIDASEATDSLPDSISFHLEASSTEPLVNVELEFGTDPVYSRATLEYSSVRLDFEADTEVELDWEWDMRRTSSVAPSTTVWWR